MHLWPSLRIRDSFKWAYLDKLEWNLQRMNSSNGSPASNASPASDRLISGGSKDAPASYVRPGGFCMCCHDILILLSCCYCCFCCGACGDDEGRSSLRF